MRQSLITLLVVITLLSQWGWVEHGYHSHDASDVCEICVSASGHVAVTPSTLQLAKVRGGDSPSLAFFASIQIAPPRYYTGRAPPHFL